MVSFYDINNWNSPVWAKPPKGSRAQRIVEEPETGGVYYFKKSHDRNPSEFWSEIIASKIGQTIGFNTLDYNLAIRNGEFGCLSKSMINTDKGEVLYHGLEVLNDYFEKFIVSYRPVFSFQDIKKLCADNEEFNSFLERFIEIILFDALIGNTDRHTENWAFILNEKKPNIDIDLQENLCCFALFQTLFNVFNSKSWKSYKKGISFKNQVMDLKIFPPISFAPIYDSGSCLGREMNEARILGFINDEKQIERYLNRGESEIKWFDKNEKFFEMVEKVLMEERELTINCAKKIFDNLTAEKIQDIVNNADNCLENHNTDTLLSVDRKKLITLLLQKRLELLKKRIKIA